MIVRVGHADDRPTPQTAVSPTSPRHAAEWLALARRCVPLARLLHHICAPIAGQSPSPRSWIQQFVHYTPWKSLWARLTDFQPEPLDQVSILQYANLTRATAHATGWATAEEAFWDAMGTPLYPQYFPAPALQGCNGLSERLLSAWRAGDDFAMTELLAQLPPDVAAELLAEVRGTATEVDPIPFDAELRDRLAIFAELQWRRRQNARQESFAQLVGCESREAFFRQANRLLSELLGQPVGLWLVLATDRADLAKEPSGIGQLPTGRYLDNLSEFLAQLPAEYRQSHGLFSSGRTTTAVPVGQIYYSEPASDEQLDDWLTKVADLWRQKLIAAPVTPAAEPAAKPAVKATEGFGEQYRAAIREFAAGAGHEINNPLATITGKARWLLQTESDPQRRTALHKINAQVDRVYRMIRDVHFVGRAIVEPQEAITLAPAVERGVALARKRRPSACVMLHEIPSTIQVWANANELSRMTAELVTNAVEAAGPIGYVSVAARRDGDRIFLRFTDSGPGFSDLDRRHAFDIFYSGRSAGRGLGMGLAVVRRIVEDHHGRVQIGIGRPTVVTVELPALNVVDTPLAGCPAHW